MRHEKLQVFYLLFGGNLFKQGVILRLENHKRINSIWSKKMVRDRWKVSIIVSIQTTDDETINFIQHIFKYSSI
jgi:hypothetical protein